MEVKHGLASAHEVSHDSTPSILPEAPTTTVAIGILQEAWEAIQRLLPSRMALQQDQTPSILAMI